MFLLGVAQSGSTISTFSGVLLNFYDVVYDRAGTGWSDSVDLPRALMEVIDELRALLRVADVPAPYVWSVIPSAASTHVTTRSGSQRGIRPGLLDPHTRNTTPTCLRTGRPVGCLGPQRGVA